MAQGGGYPPGGYGPPGPGGYGPPGPPNSPIKKEAQTWLIVSLATVVMCTSCFGIIGGALCYMAMQAADQGNLADAANKLKWGKIITIVGLLLGLVVTVVVVGMYAAQIIASLSHL